MTNDNRLIIQRALAGLTQEGGMDALAAVISDDFAHHRPEETLGKAEWLAAVRAVPLADLRVEVHHVLADGDHVIMHSRRWLEDGGPGITGVHIWRLEDGLIVEGWEIIEPVGDATANFTWWQPAGSTV